MSYSNSNQIDSPTRFKQALFYRIISIVSFITSLGLFIFRDNLFDYWNNHYGNWRDKFLELRIFYGPFYLLSVSFIALVLSFVVNSKRECWNLSYFLLKRKLGRYLIFLTLVLIAIVISILNWKSMSFPCWDGYCYRAYFWKKFLLNPSAESFNLFLSKLYASHVGVSWVPPVLIGTISCLGISIKYSFMFLNFVSWLTSIYIISKIAKKYFDFNSNSLFILIFLILGHFSVQRSFLFPQTDPLAVLMILLSTLTFLDAIFLPSKINIFKAILVSTLSLFTKMSCMPILAFPTIIAFFPPKKIAQSLKSKIFFIITQTLLPILLFFTILYYSNLLEALTNELKAIDTSRVHGYSKDNNVLRFLIMMAGFVQLSPFLLLLSKFNLKVFRENIFLIFATAIFPVALVFIKAAFWARYMLPSIPFLLLLISPRINNTFKGISLLCLLAFYLTSNLLYMLFNLFN